MSALNCQLCGKAITARDRANYHHSPVEKQAGGTEVVPTHERCHRVHHIRAGTFREAGRRGGLASAATYVWALNLRGVRDCSDYNLARQLYGLYHAR